jgi:hypothetical protein
MSPARYRAIVAELFGSNQTAAARFLGYTDRNSRRFISGETEVPKAVAMLLELMIAVKKKPDAVEKLIGG